MTYFVYILFSNRTNRYYIGQTNNITTRIEQHNQGNVKSTKPGIPWSIVWTTEVKTREESVKLERKIKNIGSKRFLDKYL